MGLNASETPAIKSKEIFLDSGRCGNSRGHSNRSPKMFWRSSDYLFDSTSRELRGGVPHGEVWFEWIGNRLRECDIAFFLITPLSKDKPWVLWEAGAAYGIALSTDRHYSA